MSRSFAGFLAFLVVLGLSFAAGVFWLGPAVVSLAFDETRRAEPYYVLHLTSLSDDVDGTDYFQRLRQTVTEEEGQLLWRGSLKSVHVGRLADERDNLLVYEFGTGGDLVQLLTSVEYRDLAAEVPTVLLGTVGEPGALAQDEALVLWLLRLRDGERQRAVSAIESVTHSARAFQGQVVWTGALDQIAGGSQWNHFVMLAFPAARAIEDWLGDSEAATELVLVKKSVTAQTLLEFSATR